MYWPGKWNISTIARACHKWWLKRAPGVWGYNWATLPLGDINTKAWFQVTGWERGWHPYAMESILLWIQMKMEARTLKKLNNQQRFIWIRGPRNWQAITTIRLHIQTVKYLLLQTQALHWHVHSAFPIYYFLSNSARTQYVEKSLHYFWMHQSTYSHK